MSKPHVVRSKTMALPSGSRFGASKAAKVSVSFDDAHFDTLCDFARKQGCSFGEAVRRFLAVGIANADEVNTAHN